MCLSSRELATTRGQKSLVVLLSEKDGRVIKNLGIEKLLGERFLDGNRDNIRSPQRSHIAKLFFANQIDSF